VNILYDINNIKRIIDRIDIILRIFINFNIDILKHL